MGIGRLSDRTVAVDSRRCDQRGDKLPTESAIMEKQGVSRTVASAALSRLQAAGLVATRHAIATFVLGTPRPSGIRIAPATLATLRDVLAMP